MAELKTKKNDKSVNDFLASIENLEKRNDSMAILEMMKNIVSEEPSMWGDSIIGFGIHHYKYASGREIDWFKIGFSPRKKNITIYFMTGHTHNDQKLNALGKHKTGVGCLYINKLKDIDEDILKELIVDSINHINKNE